MDFDQPSPQKKKYQEGLPGSMVNPKPKDPWGGKQPDTISRPTNGSFFGLDFGQEEKKGEAAGTPNVFFKDSNPLLGKAINPSESLFGTGIEPVKRSLFDSFKPEPTQNIEINEKPQVENPAPTSSNLFGNANTNTLFNQVTARVEDAKKPTTLNNDQPKLFDAQPGSLFGSKNDKQMPTSLFSSIKMADSLFGGGTASNFFEFGAGNTEPAAASNVDPSKNPAPPFFGNLSKQTEKSNNIGSGFGLTGNQPPPLMVPKPSNITQPPSIPTAQQPVHIPIPVPQASSWKVPTKDQEVGGLFGIIQPNNSAVAQSVNFGNSFAKDYQYPSSFQPQVAPTQTGNLKKSEQMTPASLQGSTKQKETVPANPQVMKSDTRKEPTAPSKVHGNERDPTLYDPTPSPEDKISPELSLIHGKMPVCPTMKFSSSSPESTPAISPSLSALCEPSTPLTQSKQPEQPAVVSTPVPSFVYPKHFPQMVLLHRFNKITVEVLFRELFEISVSKKIETNQAAVECLFDPSNLENEVKAEAQAKAEAEAEAERLKKEQAASKLTGSDKFAKEKIPAAQPQSEKPVEQKAPSKDPSSRYFFESALSLFFSIYHRRTTPLYLDFDRKIQRLLPAINSIVKVEQILQKWVHENWQENGGPYLCYENGSGFLAEEDKGTQTSRTWLPKEIDHGLFQDGLVAVEAQSQPTPMRKFIISWYLGIHEAFISLSTARKNITIDDIVIYTRHQGLDLLKWLEEYHNFFNKRYYELRNSSAMPIADRADELFSSNAAQQLLNANILEGRWSLVQNQTSYTGIDAEKYNSNQDIYSIQGSSNRDVSLQLYNENGDSSINNHLVFVQIKSNDKIVYKRLIKVPLRDSDSDNTTTTPICVKDILNFIIIDHRIQCEEDLHQNLEKGVGSILNNRRITEEDLDKPVSRFLHHSLTLEYRPELRPGSEEFWDKMPVSSLSHLMMNINSTSSDQNSTSLKTRRIPANSKPTVPQTQEIESKLLKAKKEGKDIYLTSIFSVPQTLPELSSEGKLLLFSSKPIEQLELTSLQETDNLTWTSAWDPVASRVLVKLPKGRDFDKPDDNDRQREQGMTAFNTEEEAQVIDQVEGEAKELRLFEYSDFSMRWIPDSDYATAVQGRWQLVYFETKTPGFEL